jgi:cysteinyl-tRNA synthetase
MEVAEFYTRGYHKNMELLNVLPPNIEPKATGHVIEQIEMIKTLVEKGFAYESNGSVYFDVEKYNATENYGELSGRILEDLNAGAATNVECSKGNLKKEILPILHFEKSI